ncbi:MAG: hypothetical protein JO304_00910 [Solirubrobacterales bacterium]|nr:hypothetical protein [Solirubrobacterales bacterium]
MSDVRAVTFSERARFLMIRATDWGVRGEETAPVRVTRRNISPSVIWAWSSQARSARTGHGRGASA